MVKLPTKGPVELARTLGLQPDGPRIDRGALKILDYKKKGYSRFVVFLSGEEYDKTDINSPQYALLKKEWDEILRKLETVGATVGESDERWGEGLIPYRRAMLADVPAPPPTKDYGQFGRDADPLQDKMELLIWEAHVEVEMRNWLAQRGSSQSLSRSTKPYSWKEEPILKTTERCQSKRRRTAAKRRKAAVLQVQ